MISQLKLVLTRHNTHYFLPADLDSVEYCLIWWSKKESYLNEFYEDIEREHQEASRPGSEKNRGIKGTRKLWNVICI